MPQGRTISSFPELFVRVATQSILSILFYICAASIPIKHKFSWFLFFKEGELIQVPMKPRNKKDQFKQQPTLSDLLKTICSPVPSPTEEVGKIQNLKLSSSYVMLTIINQCVLNFILLINGFIHSTIFVLIFLSHIRYLL